MSTTILILFHGNVNLRPYACVQFELLGIERRVAEAIFQSPFSSKSMLAEGRDADLDLFHIGSDKFPIERLDSVANNADETYIIGIDEAGRGPVLGKSLPDIPFILGPLVYAVFVCPERELDWLKKNGANDSKQLTEERREQFFHAAIENKNLGWRAKALHPAYLSSCMLRREKYNLNEISYDTVFGLIQSLLDQGIRISKAYVDTLGKAEKYEATLAGKFPGIGFTVRSKADALYPIVGAASIVAKVLRDTILRSKWGIEASGYPGDPATIDWMRSNVDAFWGFPNAVRFSWSSCVTMMDQLCHKVQWCDEPPESGGPEKENTSRAGKKRDLKHGLSFADANKSTPFGLTSDIRTLP